MRPAAHVPTRLVPSGDAQLEVADSGSGEPVALVQTALIADELVPLAAALPGRYRRLVQHRRGYGASSPADGPGSVARDAADCRALLAELHIEQTHVIGLSYAGAVAMQLAVDEPALVRSLVLIEPPPVHVPSADQFRAANVALRQTRAAQGAQVALDGFLTRLVGPDWHTECERLLPGSPEQMRRDATTFFDADLPGLLAWEFGPEQARQVGCPVLHVGGSASGPWFAEVRTQVLEWFPHAEDILITGADHNLAMTHTEQVAAAVTGFLASVPRPAETATVVDARPGPTGPQ